MAADGSESAVAADLRRITVAQSRVAAAAPAGAPPPQPLTVTVGSDNRIIASSKS